MSSRMQRPRARIVLPALALCAAAGAAMRALPAPATPAPRLAALPAVRAEGPGAAAAQDTVRPVLVNAAAVVRALDRQYPPEAGITGTASLRVLVSAEGVPADVQAVQATHPAFGQAAVRAMQTARFRPARHEGTPVAFTLMLPVLFELSGEDGPPPDAARVAEALAGARQWDQAPVVANAAEVTRALRAEYPPALRAAGVEARAQVRLRISQTGEVLEAAVESASHPEAGPAAARALRRARFTPARRDGRPVEVQLVLPVLFQPDPVVAP